MINFNDVKDEKMPKLLYITVNTKPEELSTSKTVGRRVVNKIVEETGAELVELDLCQENIPEPDYKCFESRAQFVSGPAYDALTEQQKYCVDRATELSDQFLSADIYVIAAPMWSLMFPARLKMYLDCIMLNNKLIQISDDGVTGLLDDKDRRMIYVQSSGGNYPDLLWRKFNVGIDYFNDIFKFLGVEKFEKLLIEGVDMQDIGKDAALQDAYEKVDKVVKKALW